MAEKSKETEKDEKKEKLSEEKGLDPKYLKGLMFGTAKHEPKKDEKTGNEKTVHTRIERTLTPADVLSWRDDGDTIIIVAKNGKKHEVKK